MAVHIGKLCCPADGIHFSKEVFLGSFERTGLLFEAGKFKIAVIVAIERFDHFQNYQKVFYAL